MALLPLLQLELSQLLISSLLSLLLFFAFPQLFTSSLLLSSVTDLHLNAAFISFLRLSQIFNFSIIPHLALAHSPSFSFLFLFSFGGIPLHRCHSLFSSFSSSFLLRAHRFRPEFSSFQEDYPGLLVSLTVLLS